MIAVDDTVSIIAITDDHAPVHRLAIGSTEADTDALRSFIILAHV